MNAVIYARFSSDNQSEESITAQIRACTEYAERNGYEIINTYIDRAFSARSDQRPEFQRMICDSSEKSFNAVIVHKIDRFSRDRYDHAIYRKELKKNGVRLISVLENLDDSPESVVLESVLEGFSEYYSRNLARETRKGLKEVALQAKLTGGRPPFGYDVDENNNYIINKLEADAVRQIFQACLNGQGYTQLIRDFEKRGIKSKMGKPFGKNSFNAILKNEKYMGRYVYYPIGTYREKISEPIIIEDAIPAIIDKKTFMEVQRIMESRKNTGRTIAVEPYLLSGILFCGECGAPMSGHRSKKSERITYAYECSQNSRKKNCEMRSFSRDKLEGIICDYVEKIISPEQLGGIKQYLKENQNIINRQNEGRIANLKKEITALDTKINNTIDLLIETKSDKLKEKLSDLEKRQKDLVYECEKLSVSELEDEKIEKYLIHISDFKTLPRKEKQLFVKKIIKKVTIHKNGDLDVLTTYSDVAAKLGGTTPYQSLAVPFWVRAKLHYFS